MLIPGSLAVWGTAEGVGASCRDSALKAREQGIKAPRQKAFLVVPAPRLSRCLIISLPGDFVAVESWMPVPAASTTAPKNKTVVADSATLRPTPQALSFPVG